MRVNVMEEATGKWRSILAMHGVPAKALSGKHGPCPMCGGKDRFRFLDTEGRGTWICNQCGAGNGAGLLMRVMRLTHFGDVAKLVEGCVGKCGKDRVRKPMDPGDQFKAMYELWRSAGQITEHTVAGLYLKNRKLSSPPTVTLRDGIAKHKNGQMYNAMLARVTDADGNGVNVHRTFLSPDGNKAECEPNRMLMPGALPDGSAVRIYPEGETLGIAEGIETAIAASMLFKVPVWAALNANRLAAWFPPAGVKRVMIFGDNDASFTGQAAAHTLAQKLTARQMAVEVHLPDAAGEDWNDVIRRMA